MKNFVHLHTHSHYSLLDGLGKIGDLVQRAKELDMNALGLTDHGVLYGVIEFYQACKIAGIKPVIGMEGYIAPHKLTQKRASIDANPYHITLLAKNDIGYKNLIKISSIAHTKGYYYRPRVDYDFLKEHSEGIIALSGCVNGHVPREIINGNIAHAKELANMYLSIFGQDNFFFEIQDNPQIDKQEIANTGLIQLSKELGVPLVATNDIHYVKKEDAVAQDVLLCIQTNKTVDDDKRMSMLDGDFSMRSRSEMERAFKDQPQALDMTSEIADKCNLEIELGNIHLPRFDIPAGETDTSHLEKLCVQGLKHRYGIEISDLSHLSEAQLSEKDNDRLKRLKYELSVILKMGFASYFLIVADFVKYAKEHHILVGPGRGSAAGSIVSYLLNITNIDPLEYGLLFERFLNPDRISMPDIDLDFADDRRDDVIAYVEKKYGKDHVAQIITFGTMAARAAVRDAGRALGYPYSFCDEIAKIIPMFSTLDDTLVKVPEFRERYTHDPQVKKLINSAKKLEGVARHASVHACGVIITNEPLQEYVPIQHMSHDDTSAISQYSLHPIEDLGLLKMDFLGLKNLTIMQNTKKIIKWNGKGEIDLDTIPVDDSQTFEQVFKKGRTVGVFQFESRGMQAYMKQLQPTTINDLIALVALYRPGPIELIPEYIAGKHGRKQVSYPHESLKPILQDTYGVMVYQEQVMDIAQAFAGFTRGEGYLLVKGIAKKIRKIVDEQKEKFIQGAIDQGNPRDIAEKIFSQIEPFSRYGFNKAHSACYAYIGYITGYLKAHYPTEYMAALLTSDRENTDRVAIESVECKQLGISLLPADINESYSNFTVVKDPEHKSKDAIRFGLAAIKNVGKHIIDVIVKEREEHGPFVSLDDFVSRTKTKDLNKKSLESLIKCGALDGFHERGIMLANVDDILKYARAVHKAKDSGQESLFSTLKKGSVHIPGLSLKPAEKTTREENLTWEKELLGLYVSEHPIRDYTTLLEKIATPCSELANMERDSNIRVGGIITKVQKILTKNNQQMLFVTIEDLVASVEVLVFARVFEKNAEIFESGKAILVDGKLSHKDDVPKILCDKVRNISKNNMRELEKLPPLQQNTNPRHGNQSWRSSSDHISQDRPSQSQSPSFEKTLRITMPADSSKSSFEKLKHVLSSTQHGSTKVHLYLSFSSGAKKHVETPYTIDISDHVLCQLHESIGKDSVEISS